MEYEVFVIFTKWMCFDHIEERTYESSFLKWLKVRRSTSMDVKTCLACGVLYLCGQGTLKEKAAILGMPRSTFEAAAWRVVEELFRRTKEVIMIPPQNKQVFMRCRNTGMPFPGALFALDGTHVRLAVKGRRNDFYGHKGYASLNVQVMCDWQMNLVNVESNFTGRTHDSDVYRMSSFATSLRQGNNLLQPGGFIIADEGYACDNHVMRPFNGRRAGAKEKLFNRFFKSARLVVENAIGAWKQMCPLLDMGMHRMNPEKLAVAVQASAVLYQFCKKAKERVMRVQPSAYLKQTFIIPDSFVGKSTELIRKELADMFARKYPKALRAIELRSDLPPGFDMGCSLVCLNETRCRVRLQTEVKEADSVLSPSGASTRAHKTSQDIPGLSNLGYFSRSSLSRRSSRRSIKASFLSSSCIFSCFSSTY